MLGAQVPAHRGLLSLACARASPVVSPQAVYGEHSRAFFALPSRVSLWSPGKYQLMADTGRSLRMAPGHRGWRGGRRWRGYTDFIDVSGHRTPCWARLWTQDLGAGRTGSGARAACMGWGQLCRGEGLSDVGPDPRALVINQLPNRASLVALLTLDFLICKVRNGRRQM